MASISLLPPLVVKWLVHKKYSLSGSNPASLGRVQGVARESSITQAHPVLDKSLLLHHKGRITVVVLAQSRRLTRIVQTIAMQRLMRS